MPAASEALFRLFLQDFEDRAYEAEAAAEMSSRLRERALARSGRARAAAEHEARAAALEQEYNSARAEFVAAQRQRVADARYAAFRALAALVEERARAMAAGGPGAERYREMLRASLRDCLPLVAGPALVSCRREDEAVVRALLEEGAAGPGGAERGPRAWPARLAEPWLPADQPGLRIAAEDGSVAFDERLASRVARAMDACQTEVGARLFPGC